MMSCKLYALSQYPAEALLSVIPKEQLGLIFITFYVAAFMVLIFVMLHCGAKEHKPKH